MTVSCAELLVEGTNAADSPIITIAAHFAFGGGLFYGVQKFFEEVEKKLSVATKDDIALWLLDLHPSGKIVDWRPTFSKIFERVFGEKQLSWKCFWRSAVASIGISLLVIIGTHLTGHTVGKAPRETFGSYFFWYASMSVLGNIVPDYISLWKTRYLFNLGRRIERGFLSFLLLAIDAATTLPMAILASVIGSTILLAIVGYPGWPTVDQWLSIFTNPAALVLWFIPAFFGRLWLLAYVGPALLLKTARRLDLGFAWFNKRFDVENHPLQCIGLVAGALCAFGYWILAAIHLVP